MDGGLETVANRVQPVRVGDFAADVVLHVKRVDRRAFLKNTNPGGLKDFSNLLAYLPGAGNDYSFAAPLPLGSGNPIAVSLSSRCVACHASERNQLFTFALMPRSPAPPVRVLDPARNEHGQWVAEFKMKEDSFQKLAAAWR